MYAVAMFDILCCLIYQQQNILRIHWSLFCFVLLFTQFIVFALENMEMSNSKLRSSIYGRLACVTTAHTAHRVYYVCDNEIMYL